MRIQSTLVGALLVLALAPAPADAAFIYSPNSTFLTQEGNSNNVVFKHTDGRTQWVFSAHPEGLRPS